MKKKLMHICTLFDSNYIDKGLALYHSLSKACNNFIIYIFAFDAVSFELLKQMNLKKAHIIGLDEFETNQLRELKKIRSKGEYCWTCTPVIIEYVLEHYGADMCTYVDADLYFYKSPQILLQELIQSGCSAGVVEHRFPNTPHGRQALRRSGKYCVQFNTFKNDVSGRKLLSLWKNQCLEECSIDMGGDQKYLTNWGEKYSTVHEYQHIGGGVAPWNLMRYKIKRDANGLNVISKKEKFELIFYHFQGIQYSDNKQIKINVITSPDGGIIRKKAIQKIYYPYLYHIEIIRDKEYPFFCILCKIGNLTVIRSIFISLTNWCYLYSNIPILCNGKSVCISI